jgi:hypothetical protein
LWNRPESLFIKMIRQAWKNVSTAFLAVALTLLEHQRLYPNLEHSPRCVFIPFDIANAIAEVYAAETCVQEVCAAEVCAAEVCAAEVYAR